MARYSAVSYSRPQNTKGTLKRFFRYFLPYKKQVILIAILDMITSFVYIIGTYMFKPVINLYIIPKDYEGLLRVVIFMAILFSIRCLGVWEYNRMMVHIAQKIVADIRRDLFRHTQKLPLTYFDTHAHGDIMSRFTNDMDTITEALNNSFTTLLHSAIILIGTFAAIMVLNFRLSLVVYFFQAVMFLYVRYSTKQSRKYYRNQQENLGTLNGFIEERIMGQKVEKVFNHESEDFAEFCECNEQLRQASTGAAIFTNQLIPVTVAISFINYSVSAMLGGFLVLNGELDLGGLTSYLIFVRQTSRPVNDFVQQINFVLAAMSGAERIFNMMDEEPEIDNGNVTLTSVSSGEGNSSIHYFWKNNREPEGKQLIQMLGDVRFTNVEFGYNKDKPILKDITLYAKPGQKIAFVGSTGAGKTTIINLINRFYDIDSGKITYDGIDIKDIRKDDLRHAMAVVVQDTHLFTGTIAENIRYGKLDATDEEIRKAACLAHADSFIRRLPEGYHTMLYNDGGNLSQGQRQLLTIARAAIAHPPVLILDEATSSIDTRTEHLIEKGMDSLMEGRTVFVIAHRLSTVRNSNSIMVLEHGDIIERGTHDQLVALHGRYYSLYTGQFELS